jgi:hypothetical protein
VSYTERSRNKTYLGSLFFNAVKTSLTSLLVEVEWTDSESEGMMVEGRGDERLERNENAPLYIEQRCCKQRQRCKQKERRDATCYKQMHDATRLITQCYKSRTGMSRAVIFPSQSKRSRQKIRKLLSTKVLHATNSNILTKIHSHLLASTR